MQVQTRVDSAWFRHSKLNKELRNASHSSFAFNFNLRPYSEDYVDFLAGACTRSLLSSTSALFLGLGVRMRVV